MRIHYLQHVPFEGLGSIERWAKFNDHSLSATRFYDGEALPRLDQIEMLVILGGPMNIYEEDSHPWLIEEKALIKQALESDTLILGICLGAQLIADALGAKIYRNPHKEIGWFPLELTDQARESQVFRNLPSKFTALHWHGDTFELPAGATHIAKSDGCSNQAFTFDSERVVGLQFHLEWTTVILAATLRSCADDLTEGKYVQTPDEILRDEAGFSQINDVMEGIIDRFTSRRPVGEKGRASQP